MMSTGNESSIMSWYDLQTYAPKSPLEIISYAKLGTVVGELSNETYQTPVGGTWDVPLVSISSAPLCYANGTDSAQKNEDALQWNFQHKTWYGTDPIAIPLRELLFLRSGNEWKMKFGLSFASAWTMVMLSFRNNAATRGDDQGTIPVIKFGSGSFSGNYELELTLQNITGQFMMGLVGRQGSHSSMFEMEWVLVP
jgi:hypothetical protein